MQTCQTRFSSYLEYKQNWVVEGGPGHLGEASLPHPYRDTRIFWGPLACRHRSCWTGPTKRTPRGSDEKEGVAAAEERGADLLQKQSLNKAFASS